MLLFAFRLGVLVVQDWDLYHITQTWPHSIFNSTTQLHFYCKSYCGFWCLPNWAISSFCLYLLGGYPLLGYIAYIHLPFYNYTFCFYPIGPNHLLLIFGSCYPIGQHRLYLYSNWVICITMFCPIGSFHLCCLKEFQSIEQNNSIIFSLPVITKFFPFYLSPEHV